MSIEAIKALIEKIAPPEDRSDFNPCDASGGNYDDAYATGWDDGYQSLAQDIRELIK